MLANAFSVNIELNRPVCLRCHEVAKTCAIHCLNDAHRLLEWNHYLEVLRKEPSPPARAPFKPCVTCNGLTEILTEESYKKLKGRLNVVY